MIKTAGEYVQSVNAGFSGLVADPSMERFEEFKNVCEEGVLDPDVVGAFNSGDEAQGAIDRMQAAIDAQTTDGNFLFRCSGYAALARESGIVAIHSALVHIEKPLTPDPVEALYPDYSNMALIKAGRSVLSDANWPSMGQASNNGEYAGVTGGLFMHGSTEIADVRAMLLEVPEVIPTLEGIETIDQLAGLADQYRAELAVGLVNAPVLLDSIKQCAADLSTSGVNIH